MFLAELILYTLGTFVGAWGASLFLRALAARVEALAARLAVLRGKRAKAPLSTGKRVAGLIAGPLLVALGASVIAFTTGVRDWDTPFTSVRITATTWTAAGLAGVFLGLVAFYIAWQYDPARGRRRCPKCWYAMEGLGGDMCPECGTAIRNEAELLRTRRSAWMAVLAAVMLFGGLAVMRIPAVLTGGWRGAVPTTVLIAGVDWLPDILIADSPLYQAPSRGTLAARTQSGEMAPWQHRWLARKSARMTRDGTDAVAIHRGMVLGGFAALDVTSPRLFETLLRGLESPDDRQRDAALAMTPYLLGGLGRQDMSGMKATLLRLLAQPIDRVAIETATIVTYMTDESAFALEEALRQARDPATAFQRRSAMISLVGVISQFDAAADRAFVDMCERADPGTRAMAIRHVPGFPDPERTVSLIRWCADPDPSVSNAAASAILASYNLDVEPLALALSRPDAARRVLIAALRDAAVPNMNLYIGLRDVLATGMADALQDPDPATVHAACEFLLIRQIVPAQAVPTLQAIAADERYDTPTRDTALNLLQLRP